ncbi:DUF4129 domain-containing protein [Streptosporangium pseudovulgare]|uniref:Protein-glutamine gamma-glutamyltransferase-like C-terminal domain-containing protein n=1 Tax=Streptosporangium pseudovulgare TaxID=35765 RepID=A0ABQ2RKH3_9ACTN|nr:DUF4129 domain-containing protein [Streptosporangium pseudovulgare]GGQ32592.1 hypothetical protein GCM10010140_73340 [Streptosporangium pseudovulgare]
MTRPRATDTGAVGAAGAAARETRPGWRPPRLAGSRRSRPFRWPGWASFALVALGLLAAGISASAIRPGAAFHLRSLAPDPPTGRPRPSPAPGSGDMPLTGEDTLGGVPFWTLVVLGAAFASVLLVSFLRTLGRLEYGSPEAAPAREEPPVTTGGEIRAALRAGLADLDAGGDPRRAVIACWLRLEHAAAGAGTPRMAADTPAELVARLLAGHRVGEPALNRLAAAYRRARYAPHEVTGSLRAEARAALAEVDAELAS